MQAALALPGVVSTVSRWQQQVSDQTDVRSDVTQCDETTAIEPISS
jgi:hypothetical protein